MDSSSIIRIVDDESSSYVFNLVCDASLNALFSMIEQSKSFSRYVSSKRGIINHLRIRASFCIACATYMKYRRATTQ